MKWFKNLLKHTDWILLIFLFMVANHAMFTLKLAGLAFIYILRPNLKFGFFKGRIPKFYLFIVVLALINLLIHVQDFSFEYLTAFVVGNSFWIFGLLIHHQLRRSVEKNGDIGVVNTMRSFILLNLGFCLWQTVKIAMLTHTYNPFTQLPFPYGMSTGDKIFGFFMENSYYNMMVSAMIAIYFIFKRDLVFSLLSTVCMLMVFGNVGTIAVWVVLAGILVVSLLVRKKADFEKKSGLIPQVLNNISVPIKRLVIIPMLVAATAVFYLGISPENADYLYKKLGIEMTKAVVINTNTGNGNSAITPTIDSNGNVIHPKMNDIGLEPDPGKVELTGKAIHDLDGKKLSYNETIDYLKSSPAALLLGAGTTRFSSVTAQRMSGLDSSRLFSKVLPHYCSPEFFNNHRLLIRMRMSAAEAEMSNANWPDSFYNQIFGEYGILGFILFLVFYVWYFVKDIRYWSYSFWLSAMLFPFALISYMFEPLCVMVFFEFLVVSDIMNNKKLANES